MSHRKRGGRASAAVLAGLVASTSIAAFAQTTPPAAQISIGAADIGGVVASAHGPEAGV